MVLTPKSGVSKNPASKAPITPTTMLRNTPCCASVPMIRLAIHPRMPPIMSHRMKFILSLLLCCVQCAFFSCLTPSVRLLLQLHRCKCRTRYDTNSTRPLILRDLSFYLLHFERNHRFAIGSCTSNRASIHMAQGLLMYKSALCSQAR